MKIITSGILSICMGLSIALPIAVDNNDSPAPETTALTNTIDFTPETASSGDVSPRAFTTLVIDVYPAPESGVIRAGVQNTFTLFPTTVSVALYVFTSPTYITDITQMKQEGYAYIHDLDMGQTLTIDTPTNGEKKYWMAYMWYQCGNEARKSGQSEVKLFNADGSIPPY